MNNFETMSKAVEGFTVFLNSGKIYNKIQYW